MEVSGSKNEILCKLKNGQNANFACFCSDKVTLNVNISATTSRGELKFQVELGSITGKDYAKNDDWMTGAAFIQLRKIGYFRKF